MLPIPTLASRQVLRTHQETTTLSSGAAQEWRIPQVTIPFLVTTLATQILPGQIMPFLALKPDPRIRQRRAIHFSVIAPVSSTRRAATPSSAILPVRRTRQPSIILSSETTPASRIRSVQATLSLAVTREVQTTPASIRFLARAQARRTRQARVTLFRL